MSEQWRILYRRTMGGTELAALGKRVGRDWGMVAEMTVDDADRIVADHNIVEAARAKVKDWIASAESLPHDRPYAEGRLAALREVRALLDGAEAGPDREGT